MTKSDDVDAIESAAIKKKPRDREMEIEPKNTNPSIFVTDREFYFKFSTRNSR